MKIWEAKSEYQKSLEAKVAELDDVPSKLKGDKKSSKQKSDKWYKLGKAQLKFKQEREKGRIEREIENKKRKAEEAKSKRVSELKGKAAESIKGIKTQQISKDDKEGEAYKKLFGNVGSAVGGVAGAAVYGARALAASRKKIEEPQSKQQKMKEPGKPGRPSKTKDQPSAARPSASAKPALPGQGMYQGKLPSASSPMTGKPGAPRPSLPMGVDKRKMLPGSTQGGSRVGQPAKNIGQPAAEKPALPMALNKRRMLPGSTQGGSRVGQPAPGSRPQVPGSQKRKAIQAGTYKPIKSMGENYSNWRAEFIIEHELIVEIDDISTKKGKKKKIVDVMRGKNKVEINPKIGNYFGYNESYDDETFRQHSRETFSSHTPSESRKRTAAVLKLMKQMNADSETSKKKKKKKKKSVSEECGCMNDKKKVLAMAIIKKAVDAKKKKNFQLNNGIIGEAKSPAWQRSAGKNPTGGLNREGIRSYRRQHPGSKLSLAVTTKPSKLDPDSKPAKRRKSFCARMGGMPGPMKDEKGRPTRKALSLRKWNC